MRVAEHCLWLWIGFESQLHHSVAPQGLTEGPHPGHLCPQGTLGDVWGISGHHDWGAPGFEWVGPRRLLHTLQSPRWSTEGDRLRSAVLGRASHIVSAHGVVAVPTRTVLCPPTHPLCPPSAHAVLWALETRRLHHGGLQGYGLVCGSQMGEVQAYLLDEECVLKWGTDGI